MVCSSADLYNRFTLQGGIVTSESLQQLRKEAHTKAEAEFQEMECSRARQSRQQTLVRIEQLRAERLQAIKYVIHSSYLFPLHSQFPGMARTNRQKSLTMKTIVGFSRPLIVRAWSFLENN